MSSIAATLDLPESSEVERKSSGAFATFQAAASLLLVAVAHLPFLYVYCKSLLALPQYEYILALPIFAGILVYGRAWRLGSLNRGATGPTVALFLISALLVCVATVFDSPWLGAISGLWAILAGVYAWGGRKLTLAFLPAWIVLWLIVRLPFDSDTRLIQELQSIAARRASILLHNIGQPHILQGNVIETPEKVYAVEEACSGVQSLFAITACTVFFVLWSRMAWWRSLLILVVAWWWVWAANVARVILVTYLNSNFNIPVDTGWMHDALGLGLFGVTLLLIYSSGRFLWFVLPFGILGKRDGIDTEQLAATKAGQDILPTSLPRVTETSLASAWLILLYLSVVCFLLLPQIRVPTATASPTRLESLDANLAIPEAAGWVLVPGSHKREERKRDSQWGAYSQAWRYRKGERELVVSIDYPFMGWHDLGTCYAGGGWALNSREQTPFEPGATADSPAEGTGGTGVILRMQKPAEKDFGIVLFQVFNGRMTPLSPPQSNVFKILAERLSRYRERLLTFGAAGADLNSQTQTFQIQIFLQDHAPFTPQDERDLRQLYTSFRARLAGVLGAGEQFVAAPAGEMP
ncbi:MAG: exosortase U [Planctomycetes bacterium]|nr:exosortase U [Planctomycetota bacterium]